MIVIHCEQGTEEWLAARAGVITASTFSEAISTVDGLTEQQAIYVDALKGGKSEAEAKALAGYQKKPTAAAVDKALAGLPVGEPSDAALNLAVRTAFERISGKPYGPPQGSFFATERGHIEEDFARMRYEARHQVMVDESGLCLTDDRLFGYSADGFVGNDGLIEVKTPLNPLKVLHIIQTGDIDEYMHQIQGGMWITDRKWCDFLMAVPDLACLNNGNELYVKRVYRDDDFIETMERQLWEHALRVKKYEALLRTPYGAAAANDPRAALAAAA